MPKKRIEKTVKKDKMDSIKIFRNISIAILVLIALVVIYLVVIPYL